MSLPKIRSIRLRPCMSASSTSLIHRIAIQSTLPRHVRKASTKPSRPSSTAKSKSSSKSSAQKPIVLEQPTAFRPPSHPAHLRRKRPRMVYGRELTDDDREDMESKSYPYAMPGRKTFMYQVLHARWFHASLSISVLTSLIIYMWILDFHANNTHPELLPHSSLFFRHPFTYLSTYYKVWRLDQAERDRAFKEKREREVRDVEGRRRFREAHDVPEATGLAAWLGLGTRAEEERLARKAMREQAPAAAATGQTAAAAVEGEDVDAGVEAVAAATDGQVEAQAAAEGARPKRKVFFGIWGI